MLIGTCDRGNETQCLKVACGRVGSLKFDADELGYDRRASLDDHVRLRSARSATDALNEKISGKIIDAKWLERHVEVMV